MNVGENYTTNEKINADTTGLEIKKTVISSDAYCLSEAIYNLINRFGAFNK